LHEFGIAIEVYRVARAAVERREPGRLECVKVAVGELSAVEPELLRFAWEGVVQDGPDAGARLEIEWRLSRLSCPECGEVLERRAGAWLRLCPDCGRPVRVNGGDELDLLEVEFEPGTEEERCAPSR
jgi:hydrogenase nickel insertion protein HypA